MINRGETWSESEKLTKKEKLISGLKSIFLYESGLEYRMRLWVHLLLVLGTFTSIFLIGNNVFKFGVLVLIPLLAISIPIFAVIYGYLFSEVYHTIKGDDAVAFVGTSTGLVICLCLFTGIPAIVIPQDRLTITEKYKPDRIIKSDVFIMLIKDGESYNSNRISDYTNPKPMICKEKRWNEYNIRMKDNFYICR